MRQLSGIILLSVFFAGSLFGQDSDSQPGSDGKRTYISPGDGDAAIREAILSLRAGDTLIFRKGVHRIGKIGSSGKPLLGTEKNPIVIRGENGAILQGLFNRSQNKKPHGPDESSGISVGGKGKSQWVIVENLIMRNNATISVGNHNITYRNCHFDDYSNYGLITNGMRGMLVENCRFSGSAYEHGIYLTVSNHDITIRNCVFTDTAINGIHINGPDNRRIIVENNIFHHNSRGWGACITLMGARETVIRNNLFYCNLGHIITFTKGKLDDGKERNIEIVHNTVYQPDGGRNGQMLVIRAPLNAVTFSHNIVRTNANAFDLEDPGQVIASTRFDWNVYGAKAGVQSREWGMDKNGIFEADLKFVNAPGWDDTTADIRLLSGSAGSVGAPLTKTSEHDCDGRKREAGASFGAYGFTAP